MLEEKYLTVLVGLMAVVTYLPRAIPLQLDSWKWPNWTGRVLEFLPVSIVSAVTLTPLVIRGTTWNFDHPEFYAAVPTCLCAYLTKNLFFSITVGLIAYLVALRFF